MKELDLADLKVDLLIARFYHGAMVTMAVVSSGAILGSLPVIALELLPRWAELSMVGGGLLLAPGSIHETPITRHWLNQAKQAVEDYERASREQVVELVDDQ